MTGQARGPPLAMAHSSALISHSLGLFTGFWLPEWQPHESQALCLYGLQWIWHLVGAQEIFAEWISFLCSAPVPPASLQLQTSKQPDLCRPKQLLCSSPEDTLQEASKLALGLKTMLGPEQGLGSQLPPLPW